MTRSLVVLLVVGLAVPAPAALAAPTPAAEQARAVPFAIAPDDAARDLERMNRAGIHTLTDLAGASPRSVSAIVGSTRAKELRAAASRYLATDSMVDPNTKLSVPFIMEPAFIVDPKLRTDVASRQRLKTARARVKALAKVGVRTYVDLVNADEDTLRRATGTFGIWLQKEARTLAEAAGIILHNDKIVVRPSKSRASTSTSSSGLIDPTFRTGSVDPAHTRMITETGFRRGIIDPTYLTGSIEPSFLVDPSILSEPSRSR